MPEKNLPARPNLEQYRKQAKDLARKCILGVPEALARVRRHHPRFNRALDADLAATRVSLTDAQLVIAREHGFESWPKFSAHIVTLNLTASAASITDPVSAFIEAACVPRDASHVSGTLEQAELILARYPDAARANIYTAAILADDASVRSFLARDPARATATGGPHGWNPLTYLCFSRYLRIDRARSEGFVRTAKALLDAGASANTGWFEMNEDPPIFESAIYGAAGVAQHSEVTRLLLEHGADPNDEETPYHVPEGYDNTVMKVLLESGKLNERSLTWMLVRKTDWHDLDGVRLALEHGADPNAIPKWGNNALQHALRRDDALEIIELLLEHGADPALRNSVDGRSATAMAARRGRGDVLALLEQRGFDLKLEGVDVLIAACARKDTAVIRAMRAEHPELARELLSEGGTLLAEFAGTGNMEGVGCLLDLGVPPDSPYEQGDVYFDIAKGSTALHVAAWRAWQETLKLLVLRGAPVNALDGKGRSALALAVRACVDSYWKHRRSPDSVAALLEAGASTIGIDIPCGFDEVDNLLIQFKKEDQM